MHCVHGGRDYCRICCSARKAARTSQTDFYFDLRRRARHSRPLLARSKGCVAASRHSSPLGIASLIGFAVALMRVDSAFAGRGVRRALSRAAAADGALFVGGGARDSRDAVPWTAEGNAVVVETAPGAQVQIDFGR